VYVGDNPIRDVEGTRKAGFAMGDFHSLGADIRRSFEALETGWFAEGRKLIGAPARQKSEFTAECWRKAGEATDRWIADLERRNVSFAHAGFRDDKLPHRAASMLFVRGRSAETRAPGLSTGPNQQREGSPWRSRLCLIDANRNGYAEKWRRGVDRRRLHIDWCGRVEIDRGRRIGLRVVIAVAVAIALIIEAPVWCYFIMAAAVP
jgi:hypothetical protein